MAGKRGDPAFSMPHYNPIEAIPEGDIVDGRRQSDSSTGSVSPDTRNWPSAVAHEERRRSSEASKHRHSSSSWSAVSGVTAADSGHNSTRRSQNDSDGFERTKQTWQSVDTREALINFAPIAAEYMRKEEERKARLEKHGRPNVGLDEELEVLRTMFSSSRSLAHRMLPFLHPKQLDHATGNLERLAKSYFPPRSEAKVYITDFRESSAETRECRLSEATKHMRSKPEDVHVRWIHAPLGLGPLHSTIEDIFRYKGPKPRDFHHAGGVGFPYVKVEVLNLVDRADFQKMRDVYHFLHDENTLTELLNKDCWAGFEPTSQTEGLGVLDDLRWRTTHLGLAEDWNTLPDYWMACCSDVPCQLAEGVDRVGYGPLEGLNATLWQSDKQALHKHRFFGAAQVVRDPFRCFHRGDGKSHLLDQLMRPK